jgi:hypothetical protein
MRALARQRARQTLPPISMLQELFALCTDEPAFANELEQHQAKTNEPAIVEDPWER